MLNLSPTLNLNCDTFPGMPFDVVFIIAAHVLEIDATGGVWGGGCLGGYCGGEEVRGSAMRMENCVLKQGVL